MSDIWHKYQAVESEIHYGRDLSAIEAHYGAFQNQGFYEDGLFSLQHRDFSQNPTFNKAYEMGVSNATSKGVDPHIRWRARIFEYLLKRQLPGKAIELGTAHGFMFYFALNKFTLDEFDFKTSEIYLFDKFDSHTVDSENGVVLNEINSEYASDIENTRKRFADFPEVTCIQGLIPEALSTIDTSSISFLHIDLNAAQPEIDALRLLWDELLPNSVVLLDDYGFPTFAASQAAHTSLSKELGYEILGLPTGQGLIMK